LRIGINALYLLPGKVGGTETYIRNLVDGLSRFDPDNTYFIFVNKESVGVFRDLPPRITIVHCPLRASNRPARILWEQFILPFQVLRRKIDVLLSAGMTAPFFCPAASMLVIYDLQHINQPQNYSPFALYFFKTIIYVSAKTADGIMAISKHVKNDIVTHYNIRPDVISVTYLGVNHEAFFPERSGDADYARTRYNLPEKYILYAAALLPHKNHQRLLQAFKDIKGKIPGRKLVLTGAWEKGHDTVVGIIADLGLQDDVLMLGWIPFEDIPLIYRGAELFVYPTLHEGFGLPVLEAMASGVPVVCSRVEPLIEIAGDAAFFVDPYDQSDIARGIAAICGDKALRTQLVERGLLRAGEFTWDKTAKATLALLSGKKE
jgi:glycosyltransferase involved in cell wall biosynthesis